MCLKLPKAGSIGFWGTSQLKLLLENSEFQNYFGEQGNCTVPQMSPDHNTPKGERMAKTDHKLSSIPNEPPSCLFGAGNFY